MLKPVLLVAAFALALAMLVPQYLVPPENEADAAAPAADVAVAARDGIARIPADRNGHYVSDVEVNGQALSAIVDTGATVVVLNYDDARRLGLVLPGDRFDVGIRTANGSGKARRVILRSLRVGPIRLDDVDALVVERGALSSQNLLGMSFLGRLSRFEVQRGVLVLER